MAVARSVPPEPVSQAVRGRQRRQREEELLVWPDLVFVEFISAVLFTITLTILAVLVNAVLLDQADPNVTPNPSKAPWYFLNLQEMLLHMNPALAGVVVPTVALVALGAIPYIDRSHEGQGEWWGTPRSKLIVAFMVVVSPIITVTLILLDASKHVQLYEKITGNTWPAKLNWLTSLRAVETQVKWPDWTTHIPLGSKVLRTDLLGLPKINLNINFPAVLVEQIIPVSVMLGFPAILCLVAWRIRLCRTRRDFMILLFTGFIVVYVTMTIVGTFFRGEGQNLVPYSIFASKE
jgi:quinol---cytochrome c reductase cytochrome c subunit, bacillus type